jgi:hypothetical protein
LFDFVHGQLWSCGKVQHAEVKEILRLPRLPKYNSEGAGRTWVSARLLSDGVWSDEYENEEESKTYLIVQISGVLWGFALFLYLFDFRRINIYFLFCRTNSVRDLIFCLILYMVNYGRVGKYIMRKSKRYVTSPLKGSGLEEWFEKIPDREKELELFRAALEPEYHDMKKPPWGKACCCYISLTSA